jgi:carbon monoxide dehydrogenase subunit G
MTTVAASIDIDAPAERAWAVLTDWIGQSQWMPMTSVRVESGDGALGTRLLARSGLGRAAIADPMVIDVWAPPHRCEVRHDGRIVTGRGVFIVDELPGGRSRVTWEERLDSVGARRALDRAAVFPTKLLLTVALRRLARRVHESP